MIILLPGFDSLDDFLKFGTDIDLEISRECRICGGRLWRNGYTTRICLSLKVCARIEVPRVLCRNCGRTSTCLFDFLVPHKQYEGAVQVEYVSQYLETDRTYREVAWSDVDGDNDDAEASVSRAFRAVEEACESAEAFLQQVQQELVENQTTVPELDAEVCKATKKRDKQKKMELLLLAIRLAKRFCACCLHSWVLIKRYISHGYLLRQLDFRLSAPRTLKHPLF